MTSTDWLTPISRSFRRKRMERFVKELGVTAQTRILDVGGIPETWEALPWRPTIVLLNMPRTRSEMTGSQSWVAGDGCSLPFRDLSFDVVFSNSVLEHVGGSANQERFAREVERVGRGYWVQTPNLWFPVETHLLTPFIHWLPRSWQRVVVPRFTVWGALRGISRDRRQYYFEHYLSDVRLLGCRQLSSLFPGACLIRERVCGLTKSLIAVKRT